MKAEELMIGDLVYYSTKKHIVQVVGMSGIRYSFNQQDVILYGDCFKDFDGRGTWESHTTKSLSPIPLTPEILEKNGFTKITKKVYEFCTDDYRILWPTDNNNTLAINSFFAKYGILSKQNIDYVHQLQHALRLCGINKEIEL